MIGNGLRSAGFVVLDAANGAAALEKARTQVPDLILLDLMLPGMSGFEVCRALKAESVTARIPIIFVTAKADEVDRVVGLELGAEDYVVKPFSPRELILRVKTVLRRGQHQSDAVLSDSAITLDRNRYRAELNGKPIDLTTTEFRLLALLLEGMGRVQNRQHLLANVWGESVNVDTRTIDTHIRRLREKLGPMASRIETVRGFGYRLAPETQSGVEHSGLH